MKKIATVLLLLLTCHAYAQPTVRQFTFKHRWVDSVYNALTLEERIGQLFMVAAYSGGENKNDRQIQSLIDRHGIGGVIFMQGTPEAQAQQTNRFQKAAKVPLLVAMDAEWGLGMRLTGVKDLPRQMTIGASRSDTLMYEIGVAVAEQCKRLGVHINFAPAVDINSNPKNPVIGFRAFGSDKELVSRLGIAYMQALQSNGVMACAKHFPGHGDVTVDSHHDLPQIDKDAAALKALELYPFQQLFDRGVQSVMIAHLNLPQLDTARVPSTLSYNIVTNLLKKEMKFDGLIFTDALNMKGVANYYPAGEVEVLAFLAGNDVLLFSQDVGLAIQKIVAAYHNGTLTEERLAHSVKKILGAKYDKGLQYYTPVEEQRVTEDLNKAYDDIMLHTAVQTATLVSDHYKMIPAFSKIKNKAFITFNASEQQIKMYKAHYPNAVFINMDSRQNAAYILKTLRTLPKGTMLVGSLHKLSRYPGDKEQYGYSDSQIQVLQYLSQQKQSLLLLYGVPYMSRHFCKAPALLVAYEDQPAFQNNIIRVLEGALPPNGTLPVEICR